MTIIHQCGHGCWKCYGSGEGMTENLHCRVCKGTGFLGRGEVEVEFDENEMDSPQFCWDCGMDLREEVQNAEG